MFKVYQEKEHTGTYLKLKYEGDGEVTLLVVYENGDAVKCGNLITFHKDGSVTKACGVNNELGFNLNDDDELVII